MKTRPEDPAVDPLYLVRLRRHPGYDPGGDAWDEARMNERESSPGGLLESAERRTRRLLERPLTPSVARAVCLVTKTEARGRDVPLKAFWKASEEVVQLTLAGLALELGLGSEARRRQTLRTIREWCSYWGVT